MRMGRRERRASYVINNELGECGSAVGGHSIPSEVDALRGWVHGERVAERLDSRGANLIVVEEELAAGAAGMYATVSASACTQVLT